MARGGRLFPLGPVSSPEYSVFGPDHGIDVIGAGIGHIHVDRRRLDLTSLLVQRTVLDAAGVLCVLRPIFDADGEYVCKGDWLCAHTSVDRIFQRAERVFLIGKSNWQKYRT